MSSKPLIPDKKTLYRISMDSRQREKQDNINQMKRRYQVFKENQIQTLFELEAYSYQTGEIMYQESYKSPPYCNELNQFVKQFKKEKITDIDLKLTHNEDKTCQITYDWNLKQKK